MPDPDELLALIAAEAAEAARRAPSPEGALPNIAKSAYNRLAEAEKRRILSRARIRACADRRFRTDLAYEIFVRGAERLGARRA